MIIMAAQVSLSCMLLVGGLLLVRSFVALLNVDRGYNPSAVLTARLSLPEPPYTPERRYDILDDVLHRLTGIPGVTFASFTSELPLTPGGSTSALTMKAQHGGIITIQASPRIVSPQYFSTLGMRILQGRSVADSNTQTSAPVGIVNRSFAQRYLGDAALGATLPMGAGYQNAGTDATIVGVVDDVRYMSSAESTHPEIYYSYLQLHRRVLMPVLTLMVRTAGNPEDLVSTLRAAVRGADAGMAPDSIFTMEERMLRYLARPRLYAVVLGGFAAFSVIVAGVGLFGVLSYVVSQRSRELALRMALGAQQMDVIRLVFRQGMVITVIGLGAGLLASFALSRFIAAMLYGVTPYDAITYLVVPIVLLSVAAAACFAPALRAARLDPIRLLKT
jgi:predicted permease